MDMNPFPDGAGGPDERIPVTVMLTASQAARLEVLTAELRALDPSIDDNDVADAVFDTGLCAYAYDAPFHSMRPAK
jgi:hypothetical protein